MCSLLPCPPPPQPQQGELGRGRWRLPWARGLQGPREGTGSGAGKGSSPLSRGDRSLQGTESAPCFLHAPSPGGAVPRGPGWLGREQAAGLVPCLARVRLLRRCSRRASDTAASCSPASACALLQHRGFPPQAHTHTCAALLWLEPTPMGESPTALGQSRPPDLSAQQGWGLGHQHEGQALTPVLQGGSRPLYDLQSRRPLCPG